VRTSKRESAAGRQSRDTCTTLQEDSSQLTAGAIIAAGIKRSKPITDRKLQQKTRRGTERKRRAARRKAGFDRPARNSGNRKSVTDKLYRNRTESSPMPARRN